MMNNRPQTLPGVGSLPTAPPAQLPVPQAAGMPRYASFYPSGMASTSGQQFFPKMEVPAPKGQASLPQDLFKNMGSVPEFKPSSNPTPMSTAAPFNPAAASFKPPPVPTTVPSARTPTPSFKLDFNVNAKDFTPMNPTSNFAVPNAIIGHRKDSSQIQAQRRPSASITGFQTPNRNYTTYNTSAPQQHVAPLPQVAPSFVPQPAKDQHRNSISASINFSQILSANKNLEFKSQSSQNVTAMKAMKPPPAQAQSPNLSNLLSKSMMNFNAFVPNQKTPAANIRSEPRHPTSMVSQEPKELSTGADLIQSNKKEKLEKVHAPPPFNFSTEESEQKPDQKGTLEKLEEDLVVSESEKDESSVEDEEPEKVEEEPEEVEPELSPEDKEVQEFVEELKEKFELNMELLLKFQELKKSQMAPVCIQEGVLNRVSGMESASHSSTKNFREKYTTKRYTTVARHNYGRIEMGTGVPQREPPPDNWSKGSEYQPSRMSRTQFQQVSEESKKLREEAKQVKSREISDKVMAKIKFALNKLTPDNFDKVSQEIVGIFDQDKETIEKIVTGIISKAQLETKYTQIYTDLCQVLTRRELNISGGDYSSVIDSKLLKESNFRKCLILKCQDIFEQTFNQMAIEEEKDQKEMERYKSGELTDQDAKEDLENRIILRRKRKFGTVRFIGELVIKNLLNWKISFKVVDELMKEPYESNSVELACAFLTQTGFYLNKQFKGRKEELHKQMVKIRSLQHNDTIEKRVQLLIKNLVELQDKNWVEEHTSSNQGPMTITNLHASMTQPIPQAPRHYSTSIAQSEYNQAPNVSYRQKPTLGERAKEEAHRKTVVTLESESKINNKFDFFAMQAGDKSDYEDEQNEETKEALDIAEVESEKGSDDERYQDEDFKNTVSANFASFKEERAVNFQELEKLLSDNYKLHKVLNTLLNQILVDSSKEERELMPQYLEKVMGQFDPEGKKKVMLNTVNQFLKEYSNIASDAPNMGDEFSDLIQEWAGKGHFKLEEVSPSYDQEFPEMSEPLIDFVFILMRRVPERQEFWQNSKIGRVMQELCGKCSDMKQYFSEKNQSEKWPDLLSS